MDINMNWKVTLLKMIGACMHPGMSSECFIKTFTAVLNGVGPRREIALQNFKIAFPDSYKKQRCQWVRQSYEHLIRMGAECIMLQKDPRQVLEWVVRCRGEEWLEKAVASGKGAIIISGHVGNWELGGSWIAQKGLAPITAIVRHSQDPKEKSLVDAMRNKLGVKTLSKDAPMTRAVNVLRKGEFVGILSDQHGGNAGISAPFFGLQTSTSPGAAVFAWLTGTPLIPIRAVRLAPCRFEIVISPPIEWTKGNDRDAAILDITTKINQSVEEMVRAAPGQWLCQHRRFREHY